MPTNGNVRHEPIDVGEGDFGCLLNRTARLIRLKMSEQIHAHGLSDLDYIVLESVLSHWNQARYAIAEPELAGLAVLPVAEVTAVADRLARDQWIVVRPIGDIAGLEPSAKALKLDATLKDEARWLFETAFNGFSFDEIDRFMSMLRRVHDSLR